MKKIVFVAFLILLSTWDVIGQDCDCKTIVFSLIKTTQEKYIGYRYKGQNKSYDKLKKMVQKGLQGPTKDCSQLLFTYLKFFRDKHIELDETISLEKHEKQKVNIDSVINKLRQHRSNLEGFWATDNNAYVVGIVKSSWGYSGYLIHSGLKQYKVGDLKFQLFDTQSTVPAGISYEKNKDHVLKLFRLSTITPTTIYIGLTTLKKIRYDSLQYYKDREVAYPDFSLGLSRINDNVILRVPGFNYNNFKKLDSILKVNDTVIKRAKNLIIDIRRNYGGNIETSYPLLSYMYTQPFIFPGACYLPVKETIESFEQAVRDSSDAYTPEEKAEYKDLAERLKNANDSIICDSIEMRYFPMISKIQHVAIVTNRKTFSAAEIFLLIARQSKRVTVFGQPTGGMVDFGWAFEYKLPCERYYLALPAQTNTNYPKISYDIKGIEPDIRLQSEEKEWISDIIKFYEKK